MKIIYAIVFCVLVLIFNKNADASIVDQGATTKDTSTGYNWLDFSYTKNRSYNDILSNLGSGKEFDGYRYGTEDEVLYLLKQFEFEYIDIAPSKVNVQEVQNFQNLFGITGTSGNLPISQGRYASGFQSINGPAHYIALIGLSKNFIDPSDNRQESNSLGGGAFLRNSSIVDDGQGLGLGVASFLVRQDITAAPEPVSSVLFLVGGSAMFAGRIRKRFESRKFKPKSY